MYQHAAQGYGSLIPGSEYIRSLVRQRTVSKDAARRLRWMDHYAEHGNARLTCRDFGISAPTRGRYGLSPDPQAFEPGTEKASAPFPSPLRVSLTVSKGRPRPHP